MAKNKKDDYNAPVSSNSALDAFEDYYDKKPGEFTYSGKKPTFNYDDSQLKSVTEQIMNRKDFTFDINENALYNQYKDIYQKQGQLAMMDSMGQAAALSGGYGNSYAASAGAQAYQQSLDKLTEKVPELYQLAMQQYQLEGQNLLDKHNIAYGEREHAYGVYRDNVDDYYTDYNIAYGQHRDSVSDWQHGVDLLYGVYSDAVQNEQWGQEFGLAQDEFEYGQERDKILDSQWRQELAESIRQFDKQYGLDSEKFEEQCEQWAKEYGLSEKELEQLIRMNDWKIAEAGRSG